MNEACQRVYPLHPGQSVCPEQSWPEAQSVKFVVQALCKLRLPTAVRSDKEIDLTNMVGLERGCVPRRRKLKVEVNIDHCL